MGKDSSVRITSADVIAALRLKFDAPAWAFLEQVADGTGARHFRWADAVVMSVWPSRGYSIHGIEVKVSRYDWTSEMRNPAKSAAVQKFCNRWWLAVSDETIVQPGELPETWGLLVLKGGKMKCVTEAPALTPEPLRIEFVASVLRNMAVADLAKIANVRQEGYQKGLDEGQSEKKLYIEDKMNRLQESLNEFETKSGVKIGEYDGQYLGDAVKIARSLHRSIERVRDAKAEALALIEGFDKIIALDQVQEVIKPPVTKDTLAPMLAQE